MLTKAYKNHVAKYDAATFLCKILNDSMKKTWNKYVFKRYKLANKKYFNIAVKIMTLFYFKKMTCLYHSKKANFKEYGMIEK